MLKRKVFFILIILIIAGLFATAATCNMCGIKLVDDNQQEQLSEGSAVNKTDGSESSSASKDAKNETADSKDSTGQNTQGNNKDSQSGGSKDSDTKNDDKNNQGDKSNNTQNNNIEITDIVVGNIVDDHVEAAMVILTDSTYTCYPVMTIPPDGTEIYDWNTNGGSSDNGAFYMQWTTPPIDGFYTLTINISRGSASGSFLKDYYVEPGTAMAPPPEGPQITGVEVTDTNDHLVAGKMNNIVIIYTDPGDIIDHFYPIVDCGSVATVIGHGIYYEAPDYETDLHITIQAIGDAGVILEETFTLPIVIYQ